MPDPVFPPKAQGVLIGAVCAVAPIAAQAHAPVPGLEGFYSGLALPIREPALGLVALGLVLLLMQDFPHRLRRGGAVYAAGLALGLLAARPLAAMLPLEPTLLALAALAAVLTALTGDKASGPALTLLPLIGLAVGAASLPDPGPTRDVVLTTLGSLAGIHVILLTLGGAMDWLRERISSPVLPIGIRVAASWLGAVSILMLALLLRPA